MAPSPNSPLETRAGVLPQSGVDIENVAQDSTASSGEDTTSPSADGTPNTKQSIDRAYVRDYRFWSIMASLCSVSLLASFESTVIVTSLPTIVEDLNFGSSYVWVGNVFFLSSAAVQPFFGQISNLFGRRYPTLFVVALFTLGSGICGGANGPAMMIAGRAVQGAGSGGINMIIEVIIADLVPLRDRGYFMGIILTIYGIGSAVGPPLGGIIVQTTTWRWVFYINLPVGGFALVLLYFFLHVKWNRSVSIAQKLRRLDYFGNLLLVASASSVLLALTWASVVYPWSDYHILAPLILGLAGLGAFVWFEGSPYVAEPVMPLRIFGNRTSAVVYATTLLNSTAIYWVFFFMPLYFQSVMLSSPARSGVQILPMCLVAIPGAAVSAIVLAKWGKYKVLHIAGFALMTIGFGLFSILDRNSSTAEWIVYQIIPALGSGLLLNTLLPAFQAGLQEKDQAAATASWAFIRSFGSVWGVAIPATVFNSYTARYSSRVDDPVAREMLSNGNAYASATRAFVTAFPEPVQIQIRDVFAEAMRMVFLVGIAIVGLAFLITFAEREVKLRKELETEFGLEDRKSEKERPRSVEETGDI